MVMLKGIVRNGHITLNEPTDLPDGTEVTLLTRDADDCIGIPDDQWPTTPEGIAQLVAEIEALEPFDMTPDEESDIAAWRQKTKEYTIAKQAATIDGLFR